MKDAARRYIAAAIKDVERLRSILSQNEFAIYRRYIREQSNRVDADLRRLASEQGRLNAEIEKQKFAVRTLADHERAKLSGKTFTGYCWVETLQKGRTSVRWPSGDYLASVMTAVERYLRFTGARLRRQRPAWKAINLFDKRVPSVQLPAQVDELAGRAESRLKEDPAQVLSARPLLFWLWLIGHPDAKRLLRFDAVARAVVKQTEQRIAKEKLQTQREAERRWKQQQRCRIRRTM